MKYLFAATSVVLLTLAFMAPAPVSAAEEESAANQAIVAVADAQERRTRETQKPKRMRLNAKKTKLYLNASAKAPRYTCDSEEGECTCSGINDCIALKDSGDCKGGHMWEDGTDPSKGGCDIGG